MEATEKTPSPLPAVVVSCFVVGALAYLLLDVAQKSGEASFVQFGAVLAAVAYVITFADIRLGIGILILSIGLSPEVSVAGYEQLRLEDFLVPVLVASWLLRLLRTRQEFAASPVAPPLFLYLLLMGASTAVGIAAGSIEGAGAVPILAKNLFYLLIFLLVLNHVRTYDEFRAFVLLALFVSIASAFFSAFSFPAGEEQIEVTWSDRLHGPAGERANIFGGFLIMHVAIFLGLFLHLPSLRGRALALGGGGLVSYLLLLTLSRTSYVALGVAMFLYGLFKERRLLILVAFAALLFPLVAPGSVLTRALTLWSFTEGEGPPSWQSRVAAWEESLDRILQRPLLGGGLGTLPLGWLDNEYVRVAVDLGLLGLAVFLWWLWRIASEANKTCAATSGPGFMKGYAAGYLIAFIAIAVHGIGATSFTSIRTMESFMVLTGLMAALALRHQEWAPEEQKAVADALDLHSGGIIRKTS